MSGNTEAASAGNEVIKILTDAAQPFLSIRRDIDALPDSPTKAVYISGMLHMGEVLAQHLGVSVDSVVNEGEEIVTTAKSLITKIFNRAGLVTETGEVMTAGTLNDLKAAATASTAVPAVATETVAEAPTALVPDASPAPETGSVGQPTVTTGGEQSDTDQAAAVTVDTSVSDPAQTAQA